MMGGAARTFAESYAEAREKFLEACARRDERIVSYRNPHDGPNGEPLFADAAWIGPLDAEAVLVVQSATHGIEGYAGSAIQTHWLFGEANPPDGVAILFVHALNPYGFAWTRRFNEDNVDLNRSFIDRSRGVYPENAGYAALADAIVPKGWTPEARKAADEKIAAYAGEHGERAMMLAFKLGQYDDPKGVYYGGRAPTWSGDVVQKICDEHLSNVRRAALIDIHTGLGPFGHGDCLTTCADTSDAGRRAVAWYGKVSCTKAGDSAYSGAATTIIEGYMAAAPRVDWTPIGLEFGTWEPNEVRDAVRADGWLHAYGGKDHPLAPRIKAALRNAFYPGDPLWRRMVLDRGVEIIAQGLAGLASSAQKA
jgi:hypothetical protein